MAEPFLGEIRLFSFNFAPRFWALCNGQLVPINQNQALFSLLGLQYGGNGQTNFALPNLRGRVPAHRGNSWPQGSALGAPVHTVSVQQLPAHTHAVSASPLPATQAVPANNLVLAQRAAEPYRAPSNLGAMQPGTLGSVGGSQAHENRQPYLTISFCIALQGIFPSQN